MEASVVIMDFIAGFACSAALVFPAWIALVAVAWLCWPVGMMAGASMPDCGYTLGKILGLWLIVFVYWLGGASVFAPTPGLAAGSALLAGASAWLAMGRSGAHKRMFERLRSVLGVEALMFGCMVAGVYLRAMNPAITWTPPGWSAEKCTDFSWFNAAARAPSFPLRDPWFADVQANYYYFGHLVWATLFKVAGWGAGVDFNLALATLFGLTAAGVFVLAWALFRNKRWAALATVSLVAGGNLAPALQLWAGLKSGGAGLAQAWDHFDWWGPSRPIAGAIDEFPAFSFLLGDLHAHLSALPLTLAGLMALLHLERIWRGTGGNLWDRFLQCANPIFSLAIVAGLLFVTNVWDTVNLTAAACVAAAVGALAFAYSPWRDAAARLAWTAIGLALAMTVVLTTFCKGYVSPLTSEPVAFAFLGRQWSFPCPARIVSSELRTVFGAFLKHYGLLFIPMTATLVPRLRREWRGMESWARLFWISAPLALWLVLTIWLGAALIPFLALWAWLFWREWGRDAILIDDAFVASLGVTGAALAIGCELIYANDIFDGSDARINTVFKIHYFIWTVWTLAAVAAWKRMCRSRIGAGSPEAPQAGSIRAPQEEEDTARRWRLLPARAALCVTLCLAMIYPIAGLNVRAKSMRVDASASVRGLSRRLIELDGVTAAGLSGLTRGDGEAIEWLRKNVEGQTFVCEATGEAYSASGRIATYAGTCAPAAWRQHLWAWHGSGILPQFDARAEVVGRLYRNTDAQDALREMERAGCKYVVVGTLERETYGVEGAEKLAHMASPVFDRDGTAIYAMEDLARALK